MITEQQKVDLNYCGVYNKFHNESILDYPKIKDWMHSEKGKLFLSGKKDLVIQGSWDAVKIGILIERWFILARGRYSGFVTNITELADLLDKWGINPDEDEFADTRHNHKSVFIQDFQLESECPIPVRSIYQIVNFVQKHTLSDSFSQTILHSSEDQPFLWYPRTFREFILDNYLVVKVDQWT